MAIQYISFSDGIAMLHGLSTDTKPVLPSDGLTFIEKDTGKIYQISGGVWTESINNIYQPLDADLTTWAGITPGTGVGTALAIAVGSAGAFTTFNGALGTPSSGVATNLTGTASGLTAGNVTTNANLTGHITSTGNATLLGSFTVAQLNTALSDGDIATGGGTATGTNTGDQTSVSGNAGTATALQTPRTIGGVSFDGSANIVPQTIQSINEATDTTCFPLFITASGTQSLQPLNNAGLIYNSNTNALTATTFLGALTGDVTGNVTGTSATVTGATQAAITTLANLTSVQGRTVTLADAGFDVLLGWDDSGSAYKNFALADITTEASPAAGDFALIYGAEGDLRKVDWSSIGGGYTNLTQFVDQTAWRVFYSNTSGDVTELALGASGTFLKSNGAASAPTFEAPTASVAITEAEIDVGTTPVSEATIAVTDAGITTSSKIIGGLAYIAPTGKDVDELEMDALDIKFEPATGSMNVIIKGLEGYIADKFKIWYLYS